MIRCVLFDLDGTLVDTWNLYVEAYIRTLEPHYGRRLTLDELRAVDHYPGAAREQALAELDTLRAAVDTRYTAGEPRARGGRRVPRLDARDWRGKRWATRERPWVDRLGSACRTRLGTQGGAGGA